MGASHASIFADQKTILLRNKTIVTATPAKGAAGIAQLADPAVSGLYLIQFTGTIQPEWRTQLEQEGVKLLRFVPEDAFVAQLSNARLSQIKAHPFVQWVEAFRPEYKIHSSLRPVGRGVIPAQVKIKMLLSPEISPQDLATVRGGLQNIEKESVLRSGRVLQGTVTPNQLNALTESSSVLWIEPAQKIKLFDEIATKITAGDDGEAGTQAYVQQLGFDGTGVKVAVADSGLMEGDAATMHPDLAGRVDAFFYYGNLTDAADEHSHGTHVAGIVAGNAATGEADEDGYLYGLGVAPGAHLIVQRLFDGEGAYEAPPSYEKLTSDAVRAGADIGSNSWGDDTQGRYDLSAAEFDGLVRDADAGTAGDQPYILEFSAGNAGPGDQTIGSPAVAKNVIASGAVENNRFNLFIYDSGQETMADFSSRGPCEDGRIKPDVCAPGTWIASLRSSLANDDNAWAPISNNYMYQGGTSQSGPNVSGAAAVFVQYYRETITNAKPSPALVKAALINSAVDMEESGGTAAIPNNDEGWGRIDLSEMIGADRRFQFLDQSVKLTNNQTFEHHVLVASSGEPLKITLTYTDVPGFPAAIPALVNDLDLEVIAPDGNVFHGNQFESGESVPNAPAFDTINNIEGVHLNAPVPGEYIIRIRARNVVEDALRSTAAMDQDFALVVSAEIPLPGVGILFFDKQAYSASSTINLKLIDFDLAGQSSANVRITSSTEAAGENIVLHALGSTGIFTGQVATATGTVITDGKIQIAHNDTITATYLDASPAATRQTTARADLFPPVITNISATNNFGRMVVSWQTDEPANSTVYFGTNTVPTNSITDAKLTTSHEVGLENLIAGQTYRFFVSSKDEAGNAATNNNSGAFFTFVAVPPSIILLVDNYTDSFFEVPPLSGYTDALNQVGLSYEVWSVPAKGSPTFNNLKPFSAVIWRVPEFQSAALSSAERTAITNYLNNGGSLLIASMEITSRLDANGGGAFRTNVLHVLSYIEDTGAPAVFGSDNDPITVGIDLEMDYTAYEDEFKEFIGLPPDVSDALVIATNAAPILFNGDSGEVVGLRYPRIGQDSVSRVVFLSFPLDAVPMTGSDPNNRPNLLRNILGFLVPGANGIGSIALDNSTYTFPSLVTVEVADSDLAGSGQTTVNFYSTTATSGQAITLHETPSRGLFRGYIALVSQTNSFKAGELRTKADDTIWADYFDASANGITRTIATIDTVPPVITNVLAEASYTEAVVTWTTSEPSDSLVQIGESVLLNRTTYNPTLQTEHSVSIKALQPDKLYFFQVVSRDQAGNNVTDDNHGNFYTLRTLRPNDTPWTDNLENSGTNWVVLDGESGTTSWQLGQPNNEWETEAHSPTKAWGSNLNGSNSDLGDTSLISPAIYVTGGNRATLSFWHSYDFSPKNDSDIYELGEIDISTDDGNSWTPVATYEEFSDGWEQAEVDLTPYLGKVIRIGFYYGLFSLESAPRSGWMLDDIAVTVSNSNAQFAFKSIVMTNNQAVLTFTAPQGATYQIETSTNLTSWTPIQTNTASGGENVFTDTQSPNFQTRFYRLKR